MSTKSFIKAAALGISILSIAGLPASAGTTIEQGQTISVGDQDAKAVEIIEKSIEAVGGKERFEDIKYVKQSGTISVAAAGLTGTMTSYNASPDKFLLVINFPGMGETRQGLNGDVAWSSDAMNGPRVLPDDESKDIKREADITSRLNFKDQYPTIEYIEETDFDGHKAHKLRLVDTDGTESFEYYDSESSLMLGSERKVASPMGPTQTTSFLREYKELGGVLQPSKIVQKIGPTEIVITVQSAEYEEIDENTFDLPPAVQALIKAKNSDG